MKKKRSLFLYSLFCICFLALIVTVGVAFGHENTGVASGIALSPLLAVGAVASNRGRIINFLSGITGVASGGLAVINMPTNQRYHRIVLQFTTGSAAPTAVTTCISGIKLIVNGVSIRDIDPDHVIRIAQSQGYYPQLGELPLFFTEPTPGGRGGMNVNEPPDITSWDMFGQNNFQIQVQFKTGLTTPGMTGFMEFDYLRNVVPNGASSVPFLQPVAKHQFTIPIISGINSLNTIPFNYAIRRLWLVGSSLGHLTQLEIVQDGNKVLEATSAQIAQAYRQYGFNFVDVDQQPIVATTATNIANAVDATLEASRYFEQAAIFDPDSRIWKALKCTQSLIIRVTSTAAQNLTIVQETLPGAFSS